VEKQYGKKAKEGKETLLTLEIDQLKSKAYLNNIVMVSHMKKEQKNLTRW
jgi:hypothetical protein